MEDGRRKGHKHIKCYSGAFLHLRAWQGGNMLSVSGRFCARQVTQIKK